jgi:predicted phage terminase large subunit-like protein
VLVGRGGDIIIIDDPLKPEEALSDARRSDVNDWYDRSVYTRLNNKQRGCIILIMQRLHQDDLVAHVLQQEEWEVVSFPAIAEHDEEYVVETEFGKGRFSRRTGAVLHPEREPHETLEQIRRTLGQYNFAGQYQQAPAPLGGGLVKVDWFKRYADNELPEHFDQIVQSWDTASKVTELADYSVCTTWGIKGKNIYLLHVLRRRMEYPDLKRAVHEQAMAHRASVVLIEDKASGIQLIQELKTAGIPVKGYKPESDKKMRLNAQTASIENGFVYVPREAPWLADYLNELAIFPYAKYDDQTDSTSQALAWIKQAQSQPPMLIYNRQQVARKLHSEGWHLNEITKELDSTPEEVQQYLQRGGEVENSMREMRERLSRKRCARCNERLEFGTKKMCEGEREYHLDCHRLMSLGQ